jgi:hypothetical protein
MSFQIANHAVLVSFNVTRPKLGKVDKDLTREQRSNHGISGNRTIKTVKDLFGQELKDIEAAIWDARKAHYHLTLNWVADGAQLLPAKLYMQYIDTMRAHKSKIDSLVQALDYDAVISRRRVALNGTFNQADYPDGYDFKQSYTVAVNISPVPATSTFDQITDLIDVEVSMLIAENEKRITDATEQAMKSVWTKLYDVVQHVAETLKDGKCSKLYDSLIGNVVDIVNILPLMNVTNDPALNDLSDRVKKSLCSVSTDSLKKDETRQKQVAKDAQNILDVMSSYMGVFS